jgi:hypothetical protein
VSGISATQGATVINAGGTASFSTPQVGLVTGVPVSPALVGTTHAGYLWSLAAVAGSGATLDDTSSATPTFTPDLSGDSWALTLRGLDSGGDVEATYILPLLISQTSLADYPGPIALAYLHPASVATPSIGQHLFQNWSAAGAISAKDASTVTRQVGLVRSGTTGARPSGANLDVGTAYFDTSLAAGAGKPIYWNGTIWVLSDGTAA